MIELLTRLENLQIAELNPIMENIPSSLSVGWGFFPSLSRSHFIAHTVSLSL